MKRIRDNNISKSIEVAVNKKIEYTLESDIEKIEQLTIKNVLGENNVAVIKDTGDLWILGYLMEGVKITFELIDLNNITLSFNGGPSSISFVRCKLNNTRIDISNPRATAYELRIENCVFDAMDLGQNMNNFSQLVLIGDESYKVDPRYSLNEIAEKIQKVHPEYVQVGAEAKIQLMRKEGYLKVYPDSLNVYGWDNIVEISNIKYTKINIVDLDGTSVLSINKRNNLQELVFTKCRFEQLKKAVSINTKQLTLDGIYDSFESLLKYFKKVEILNIQNIEQKIKLGALPKPKKVKSLKLTNVLCDSNELKKFKRVEQLELKDISIKSYSFLPKMKKLKKLMITKVLCEKDVELLKLKEKGRVEIIEG